SAAPGPAPSRPATPGTTPPARTYAGLGTRDYSPRATPAPPAPRTVEGVHLSRPARRAFLVVHVVAAACWLGLSLGVLALALVAAPGGFAATVEAAVRAMKLFADLLLLPIALLTLTSELVLSLGT